MVKVVLVDGSSLFIKEYIDFKYKIERVSYAYQYQDKNDVLILRYDNAIHRPELGFREHKHTSLGEIVKAELPNINDFVDEVIGYLQKI